MALAEILKSAGVRHIELAAELGVTRETVSRWINGHHEMPAPQASRLLSFLNRPENLKKLNRRKPVTFEELFGSLAKAS